MITGIEPVVVGTEPLRKAGFVKRQTGFVVAVV